MNLFRPVQAEPERRPVDVAGIVGLWASALTVLAAVLIFRALADQPCTAAAACLLPPIYLAVKPLLVVACLVFLVRAAIGTLIRLIRRNKRARRRRPARS
ncbi:hypothetical protein [Leifsonia sp. NPDC077715]|uniref:hypothetical protein n=1 Tax=Leifsonia sp. NPDC077715 TaxID=3155539 RepID=UPI0034442D5E